MGWECDLDILHLSRVVSLLLGRGKTAQFRQRLATLVWLCVLDCRASNLGISRRHVALKDWNKRFIVFILVISI